MLSRRHFIKRSSAAALVMGIGDVSGLFTPEGKDFAYQSAFIQAALSTTSPRLLSFSTDSLGQGRFAPSPLLEEEVSGRIMTALLDKMKVAGYTDFRLGLPGNLIPVADKDYADHNPRWGYQNFQVYENGGATGCYAYYTIHALYKLGMRAEADAILLPMLESYKNGSFQGSCPGSNMTRDWKTWTGECWGYEGFLVDNYLALLGVLDYLEIS